MMCPFCQFPDTRVIDSRQDSTLNQIRRRRECTQCRERFSTFEIAQLSLPMVNKNAGFSEIFSEDKLRRGILKALEKRPVIQSQVDAMVARVLHRIRHSGEREIDSKAIGEQVMKELKAIDPVAYVRFASIYLSFQDVTAFDAIVRELKELEAP